MRKSEDSWLGLTLKTLFHPTTPLDFSLMCNGWTALLQFSLSFCFPDDSTILAFKKGDLLILAKDRGLEKSQGRMHARGRRLEGSQGWIYAQNERTGKSGLVSQDAIYVIPTVTKPSSQLLVRITKINGFHPISAHIIIIFLKHLFPFQIKSSGNCRLLRVLGIVSL